jgi:hypothetical protein
VNGSSDPQFRKSGSLAGWVSAIQPTADHG